MTWVEPRDANGSVLIQNLLVSILELFTELDFETGSDPGSDSKLSLWFRF